jgi:hypothetical protein
VNAIAPMSMREMVHAIEAEMREHPNQIEIPVRHYHSQGVYAREIFIPKGTLLTGKIHKYQQLNIMSLGHMLVLVDDRVIEVKAPFTIVSPPGTKRIALALEDTVWTTIHGTDETDLEKIEAHFIAQTDDDYQAFVEQMKVPELEPCRG